MTTPEKADHPKSQPEPEPEPPVNPQLAEAIQTQIGVASINLAQAVADLASAIACKQVETLRSECRAVAQSVYARLDRLEAIALPRTGIPWPPRGGELQYRVVTDREVAERIETATDIRRERDTG